MLLKRVVVTGIGVITPIGNNIPDFWKNCILGNSGCHQITKFDASNFKTQIACEVKNFDTKNLDAEIKNADLFIQYADVVTKEAVQDAAIDFNDLNRKRIGVMWGAGIGGLKSMSDNVINFVKGDGTPHFNDFFISESVINSVASKLSIKYDLHGPCMGITSACASSSHAIIEAYNLIRLGKADMFITGGSEAAITEVGIAGFSSMKAISSRNDNPKTASRPFDAHRDGFVMGEGAGCLILEDYDRAISRGAKIYCEIGGAGMSADAYHLTAPHPEGAGAKKAMKDAIKESSCDIHDIDYINVHGTSTPRGDIAELIAIKDTFGEHAYEMNISSTKSTMGHLLGAAGAVESIICILAMQNKMVPPTINQFTDDSEIDIKLNLTKNLAQHKDINVAISNTFGFGGHNASILFKRYCK